MARIAEWLGNMFLKAAFICMYFAGDRRWMHEAADDDDHDSGAVEGRWQ